MTNIDKLHNNLENHLRYIHVESARLQHGISRDGSDEWEYYFPSNFVYAFFTFNTLYNIDWHTSIQEGIIRSWDKNKKTEAGKIHCYIGFYRTEWEFLQHYKHLLRIFITKYYSIESIVELTRKFSLDDDPNGSIQDVNDVDNFIRACESLLKKNKLNIKIIKDIILFIYKIRCNLFHGIKTLSKLNEEEQQKKLDICALFTIAINQMIFSYIDFKRGLDMDAHFDIFMKQIDVKRPAYFISKKNVSVVKGEIEDL